MKAKMKLKKLLSILLCSLMLAGIFTTPVYAWDTVIDCEFCGAICGDSYICDGGDHCSEESGRDCYEAHHCISCGACLSDAKRCPMCLETCSECGDWCDACEVCLDCAIENHAHCPDCLECFNEGPYCMLCYCCFDCGGVCNDGCDEFCLECHVENGKACEGCGACYMNDEDLCCPGCNLCFDCGGRCESCGLCGDCVTLCGLCESYCSDCVTFCPECGYVCTECNDSHCPDCGACYDCVGLCEGCSRCELCVDLCKECYQCEDCVEICEVCGICTSCTDADLCNNCNRYCSECVLICVDCGSCEECTDLCESCQEYCINCTPICVDCGLCVPCTSTLCEICHKYCAECVLMCDYCFTCEHCADVCKGCHEYCTNCDTLCEDCGLCMNCCEANIGFAYVNITEPVAGAHPENAVSGSDNVSVDSTVWRYGTDFNNTLDPSDTFKAGETYQAVVRLTVDDGYRFYDDPIIRVNIFKDVNCTTYTSDSLEFTIKFTVPATAGYTVSGTATSFNSDTDEVMIQLIESGASEPAYETVVKGNTASYSIEGVATGTYTMKIMKQGHVMSEYTVTVGAENVTQDVKICLMGDVNMDNAVRITDATEIQKSLAGLLSLNEYQNKLADVNKDGSVKIVDATLIQKYLAGLIDKF